MFNFALEGASFINAFTAATLASSPDSFRTLPTSWTNSRHAWWRSAKASAQSSPVN